ncbi:MAG TPA: hypothetical protein VN806_00290 [Caulobacteraceae bacterium]|nr:hypothetical protein [Caulobacteraceae bacterium]
MSHFTLTADQRAEFERTGLLRLPGFAQSILAAPASARRAQRAQP